MVYLKYQKEIHKKLKNVKLNRIEYIYIIKVKGIDNILTKYFLRYLVYQHIVNKKVKEGNIKHITSQGFGYLLELMKLNNVIVTCYDLILWAYYNNHSLKWKLNMSGLKKADRIITISEFSKDEIVKYSQSPQFYPNKIEK